MSELRAFIEGARALRESGEPFLVATVVRVTGSSYRRAGARMLLTGDRWVAGSVSGGCLEGDVVKKGWWRTREGAALVTYDATAGDDVSWGFGLGCDGIVEVLLERAGGSDRVDPFTFLASCFERQKAGAVATVFRSTTASVPVGSHAVFSSGATDVDCMDSGAAHELTAACRAAVVAGESGDGDPATRLLGGSTSTGSFEALIEVVLPPPCLFVLGAGHDTVPVVDLAKAIGWDVVVCEPRARFATRARFAKATAVVAAPADALAERIEACARPLAVVMGHDYAADRAYLAMLLASRAKYIGMLGPRRRTARMLAELQATTNDPRIHAPVVPRARRRHPARDCARDRGRSAVRTHRHARDAPPRAPRADSRVEAGRGNGAMSTADRVGAVVLAAGASRRLGRPKQLVPWAGRPLLRVVVGEACASRCDRVAVVLGANGDAVRPALGDLEGVKLTIVENPDWNEGIAASIRCGVRWAAQEECEAVLLAVGDQPALSAAHLDALVTAYQRGAVVVASRYQGALGVPALFSRVYFESLRSLRGDEGARRILRASREVHSVDWEPGARDVDRPADAHGPEFTPFAPRCPADRDTTPRPA